MFTLPWVSLKTISEPLLQPVFQIVRYVVKQKKSVISQTILYLKKVYVCAHTHTNEHTPDSHSLLYRPRVVKSSVTFLAYTGIKSKYPEF